MSFDPYDILELPKNCSNEEIKQAFKTASLKHHPDRGGDPVKFTMCSKAKNLLLDSHKRQLYDRGGWSAVEHVEHLNKMRQEQQRKKCDQYIINLNVTLEQVYNKSIIPINETLPGDSGVFSLELKLAPNMVGNNICVENRGIASPDCITGDVIIKVNLKDEVFSINGLDIIMDISMPLPDLFGFKIQINHPSGKKYAISNKFKPDDNGNMVMHFPTMGLIADNGQIGYLIVCITPDLKDILNVDSNTSKELCKLLQHISKYNNVSEDAQNITPKSFPKQNQQQFMMMNGPGPFQGGAGPFQGGSGPFQGGPGQPPCIVQ